MALKIIYIIIKVGECQNASDFVGHPILQTCPSWSERELRFSHQYFNIFIFHNSYKIFCISNKPALRPSWSETELRFNISWVTPSPQNLALEILQYFGFSIYLSLQDAKSTSACLTLFGPVTYLRISVQIRVRAR